jgi:hypothetical protein
MSREEFKATEVEIGRKGNKIYHHPDGDMVFRDEFVPGIKLKDLAGLTEEVILDPAVVVFIGEDDWTETEIDSQTVFVVTVPHNLNIDPHQYIIELTDMDGIPITINSVQKRILTVVLYSTVALNVYATIKRIA